MCLWREWGLHEGADPLLRYGQLAVGMHPTGIHSCFDCDSYSPHEKELQLYLQTRMHSSRMRTACLHIVAGEGRCCDLWPGGREVLRPVAGGGRCCDMCPGGEGGRCCDLCRGREVLSPGPGGEGGVVTCAWGGGGCCDLCPGGREGGVVTCAQGGGKGVL